MTIAERLAAARSRISRVTPHELGAAQGVTIIDVRCGEDRTRMGAIPGSIAVPLSVLEWRCDPTSAHRSDLVAMPDRRTVLYCRDGYSSSLAAASLADLGFSDVGDLVGGIRAWLAAGFDVVSATEQVSLGYDYGIVEG